MKISDLRSLDFVINRLFMKILKTNVIVTVKVCQEYFDFDLLIVMIDTQENRHFLTRFYTRVCSLVNI